jgi:hypothetical protein
MAGSISTGGRSLGSGRLSAIPKPGGARGDSAPSSRPRGKGRIHTRPDQLGVSTATPAAGMPLPPLGLKDVPPKDW